MTLIERNQKILERSENLSPLESKLRTLFVQGKREHLSMGHTAQGSAFSPLARSTLVEPRQSPIPFLKHGASSTIITQYQVDFQFSPNKVGVDGWWPMTWVKYHVSGGSHLPARDPGGFRRQDVTEAMRLIREYIFGG